MCINRQLEPASIEVRQPVNQIVEIDPCGARLWRETLVPGWYAEKEDLLSRHVNQLAQQLRKEFRQPWTTGEHRAICIDSRLRCDPRLQIVDADLTRSRNHRLHRTSRHQHAGVGF